MLETTLPIICERLSNEAYHHGEEYRKFFSSSQIKNYLISPKYARYTQLNPEQKQSDALDLGSVYHAKLESLVNGSGFPYIVFTPPVNEKTGKFYGSGTNAYDNALESFKALNEGKIITSKGVMSTVEQMVKELLYGNDNLSPVIRTMIKNGKAEQTHLCEYQGGYFKFRPDLKTRNLIVDWKTCELEVPKPDNFERQILKYGYHISAAMYQFFDHEITGRWKHFFWVAQEKEPPYDFTIIDASEWAWKIDEVNGEQIAIAGPGAVIFMKLMEQHLICLEKNHWPGYSVFTPPDWKGRRIATPDVPGWYKNKVISFIE